VKILLAPLPLGIAQRRYNSPRNSLPAHLIFRKTQALDRKYGRSGKFPDAHLTTDRREESIPKTRKTTASEVIPLLGLKKNKRR